MEEMIINNYMNAEYIIFDDNYTIFDMIIPNESNLLEFLMDDRLDDLDGIFELYNN